MSLIFLSFKSSDPNDNIIKRNRSNTKTSKTFVKPTCNCGTVSFASGYRSGGVAYLSWTAVPGAVSYSVGGYFSCSFPPTFNVCANTNSTTISAPLCGGTFRVTANCDGGGVCVNATCSGNPSPAGTF